MQTVDQIVGGQALAVNRQELRGSGDQGLQGVLKRAAIFGLGLAQLVNDHDLGLKGIAPLGVDLLVADEGDVTQGRATDSVKERCPHGVLAATWMTAMQDSVVDLAVRVLHFEGHHVKDVLTFAGVRDHALNVRQPRLYVSRHRDRPSVTPAVAVHDAITGAEDRLPRSVSDALQDARTLGLSVFIKAGSRLNLGLLGPVDAVTRDVSENGVKRLTGHLMALGQIKKRVIVLQIGETLKPTVFFYAA